MQSFAAEPIIYLGSFPITNTFIHTILVDIFLITISVYISKNIKMIPLLVQNGVEAIVEAMYNLTKSISPLQAKPIFPYVMSFFLFILVANFTSLLPGFRSVGFFEKAEHGKAQLIPLLRGTTSDINTTFALALVSVIATHSLSIRLTGLKDYLGRYFSLNPIYLYIGILELTAEITKVISLSFRLFGNIYAGEMALGTVSNIFAFVLPLPFLLLENIVALVQALVFSILTLVFMALLTTPHHAVEGAKH